MTYEFNSTGECERQLDFNINVGLSLIQNCTVVGFCVQLLGGHCCKRVVISMALDHGGG